MFAKFSIPDFHRPSWRLAILGILSALLLAGCASAPTAPLSSLNYQRDETTPQRNLLVLLRGIGADNNVFAEEGIIDEIHKRGLPFDVVSPDAHFGYYQTHTFEQRLKEDVIDPARRQGYDKIWLAGFSMGGLGCLLYLRSYPNDVDGVMLTSPFLGWPSIHREINDAGGIEQWQGTSESPQDWERMLWSWIKSQDFTSTPPVWMGYGDHDMLTSAGPPLLAQQLPGSRVFTAPGNHTIATFKTIFMRHLDTLAQQSTSLFSKIDPAQQ